LQRYRCLVVTPSAIRGASEPSANRPSRIGVRLSNSGPDNIPIIAIAKVPRGPKAAPAVAPNVNPISEPTLRSVFPLAATRPNAPDGVTSWTVVVAEMS